MQHVVAHFGQMFDNFRDAIIPLKVEKVDVLGIPRDFDHHDQKPYGFLWLPSMMIDNPMNSYVFGVA